MGYAMKLKTERHQDRMFGRRMRREIRRGKLSDWWYRVGRLMLAGAAGGIAAEITRGMVG